MLEHARNLSNTVYEGLKRSVVWAAYYFTHLSSYYPIPQYDMPLSALHVMSHLKPLLTLTKDQENEMREWAMDFGKCVRQRFIRQQTTMYNTGTLPLNMYINRPNNTTRVAFQQTDVEMQEVVTSDSVDENYQFDQVSEYDSDSDVADEHEEMGLVLDTPACFDFMQGVISRSGRTI
ncbi:unnamed protein product [Mytilus coruscus]|uniref:Uncharacterized protein n=1 Tax=Mytilus coruscus TaxID=42192 RepID=A0A6J8CIU3_MYTCO|nr:unnamed protein product [Mytilus coruscus]